MYDHLSRMSSNIGGVKHIYNDGRFLMHSPTKKALLFPPTICDRPREKGPFVVARINGEIDKIHEISVISRFFKHITGG